MATNDIREMWNQFSVVPPTQKYSSPLYQVPPGEGLAGLIRSGVQGFADAQTQKQTLIDNYRNAAANVAKAEMEQAQKDAAAKAETDARYKQAMDEAALRAKAGIEEQKLVQSGANARSRNRPVPGALTARDALKMAADSRKAFFEAEKTYITERNAIYPTGYWQKGMPGVGEGQEGGKFGRASTVQSTLLAIDGQRRTLAQQVFNGAKTAEQATQEFVNYASRLGSAYELAYDKRGKISRLETKPAPSKDVQSLVNAGAKNFLDIEAGVAGAASNTLAAPQEVEVGSGGVDLLEE